MVISEVSLAKEENMMSAQEVATDLGITMNNLRQMQYRKSLVWVKKAGRNVYYDKAEVEAYKEKRTKRNKL
jgi:phage antirepressor YoqD-like protein